MQTNLFSSRFNISVMGVLLFPIFEHKLARWSSPTQLLRDPTWCSCSHTFRFCMTEQMIFIAFNQEEIFPDLTGQRVWKQNSWIGFLVRSLPWWQTMQQVSCSALCSWDELDNKLALLEWSASVRLCTCSSFLYYNPQQVSPVLTGSFERSWTVFTIALCIYSGEASIFRSSPSSRSESAMLSAES